LTTTAPYYMPIYARGMPVVCPKLEHYFHQIPPWSERSERGSPDLAIEALPNF